jgi:acyl-CoA thioester hydrolase
MTEPEYRHRLRVRYAETDAGRVAHHSSYAAWLEEARTEWMRSRGTSYHSIEAQGCFLMVTEMRCRYLSPARYDDELEISVSVKERRRASIELEYGIRRVGDDKLVAMAATRLASTDQDGRVRRWPAGV